MFLCCLPFNLYSLSPFSRVCGRKGQGEGQEQTDESVKWHLSTLAGIAGCCASVNTAQFCRTKSIYSGMAGGEDSFEDVK